MPTPVIVLAGLAVSVVAAAMIDLTRHDVRVLPKWAWGLIILVAFPFGVIAYLVMGRSRPGTVHRATTPSSGGGSTRPERPTVLPRGPASDRPARQ